MRPKLINAGIYLYKDHYLIKRRDCRAWDILPIESDGVTRHRVKSREDCVRQVNAYHGAIKSNEARKEMKLLF